MNWNTDVNEHDLYNYEGRPLKVLFLGNPDCMGIRSCLWARRMGVHGDLYICDEGHGVRNNFRLYLDEPVEDSPWIKYFPIPDILAFMKNPPIKKMRQIAQEYDVIVSSGNTGLMIGSFFSLPRLHLTCGSEVGNAPLYWSALKQPCDYRFPRLNWFRKKYHFLKNARYHRRGIRTCDLVLEHCTPNFQVLKKLGVAHKAVFLGFGEDIERNRKVIIEPLRCDLLQRYSKHQFLFLWLSRLNFTQPSRNIYKGVERYVAALEQLEPEIRSGKIGLVFGRHGNDLEKFLELVKKSPIFPYINWVEHLDYPNLLTYLSLPNAVLFPNFGEHLHDLTGIGRDASTVGTVTISSTRPDFVTKTYGRAAPVLHAKTPQEILQQMKHIISLDSNSFNSMQSAMRTFGEDCVDYKNGFIPRLFENIQSVLKQDRN